MAIGNLFLGAAKKTIGDIVLYRRNGVQQSRVRVRHIANPKTEAQALQRNYMAPVTKFYAPLAGVLEKSWEGLNRSESLSAFLKANVTLARQSGWYVEKGAEFLALPYQVSKGILAPLSYSIDMWMLGDTPNDIQVSTISAILVNMGYLYGDQVTFIGFIQDETKEDIRPVWSRFILSDSDTNDVFADIANVMQFVSGADQIGFIANTGTLVGCAMIVSRWDGSKWLRSTQFVKCNAAYLQTFTSQESRAAAIASYRGGDSVVSSDIYLNGGSGSKAATSELVLPYVQTIPKTRVGYVIPISAYPTGRGEEVILKCRNAANGAMVDCGVVWMQQPNTNYGHLLKEQRGKYRFPTAAPQAEFAIPYYGMDNSVALYNWLVSQGRAPED